MLNKQEKRREIPFVSFPDDDIETDPQGSYTGVPEEQMEEPVQDADDL